MKTKLFFLTIFFVALATTGCKNCIEGSGVEATKIIQADIFTKIKVEGKAKIFLKQGHVQEIKVVADSNLVEILKFSVSRDRLTIENNSCLDSYSQLNIYITVPMLSELVVEGDAEVKTLSRMTVDDFDVETDGSGRVQLNLVADDLDAKMDGSGVLEFEGQCDNSEITLRGSGVFDASRMLANSLDLEQNGSADAKVSAHDDLNITINGSGTVFYRGKPSDLSSKITGTGRILQLD